MTKNKTMYFASIAIILAIFNAIAWVVPFEHNGSFWVGYSFSMVAILLSAGVILYAFDKESWKSRFYGVPLAMVAWRYLIAQLITGIGQMCMSFVPGFPYWVGLILNCIMLGAFLIGLFTIEASKDEIVRIDEKVAEKRIYIKSLQVDVETLSAKTSDDSAKKLLKDLAETIRFSDPMSSPQLATLENKIEIRVGALTEAVEKGDNEAIKAICEECQQLFAERNRKCKSMK